jgi:hypothetical protein
MCSNTQTSFVKDQRIVLMNKMQKSLKEASHKKRIVVNVKSPSEHKAKSTKKFVIKRDSINT